MRTWFGGAWIAVVLAIVPASGAEEGFKPLVSGDDPAQFTLVGITKDAITVKGGEIRLAGKPIGYFATREAYKNYTLKFAWRYERPEGLKSDAGFVGNSGLLLHVVGEKIWPEGHEVQLLNSDAGNLFAVPPGTIMAMADPAAQKRAIKPVGEWNEAEVTCQDGSIVSKLNGLVVARGRSAKPDQGKIGWQSEGNPIRFKDVRIRVLD